MSVLTLQRAPSAQYSVTAKLIARLITVGFRMIKAMSDTDAELALIHSPDWLTAELQFQVADPTSVNRVRVFRVTVEEI